MKPSRTGSDKTRQHKPNRFTVRKQSGSSTLGKLLDQLFATNISTADKLNTKVKKTVVNGVPAYLMTTKADDTKIYVSADGKALLMRVVGSKGQQTTLDFTEWNAVPPMSAPAADQLAKMPGL